MDRVTGIQLFIRIVETGSFSKASADLGVTQPTATKHVAALEARLGARLLHRSTRGVTPTEVGALYYDKCKLIKQELEEADNLATLVQSKVGGTLRVNTSVAFGRRVIIPLTLRFMESHPELVIDLSFEDRYVDLVERGIDLAVRMGQLADSSLGARYLGTNPWVLVGAPAYLKERGAPAAPQELSRHNCLVYSSVMGDDHWSFSQPDGSTVSVRVKGSLRSNNLSAVLAACVAGHGLAVLPWYVARQAVADGLVQPVMTDAALPSQDVHAVFPSPKRVPAKVQAFIEFLQASLEGEWWLRAP